MKRRGGWRGRGGMCLGRWHQLDGLDLQHECQQGSSTACTDYNTDCVPINYYDVWVCVRLRASRTWRTELKCGCAHKISVDEGFKNPKCGQQVAKTNMHCLRSKDIDMQYSSSFDLIHSPWDCSTVSIPENCEISFAFSCFISSCQSGCLFLTLVTMLALKWKHLALSSIHPQPRWRQSTRANCKALAPPA